VQEYEDAGVAGIHLEDQVSPKKCGHMEGKQVIAVEEATAKIRAAVNARSSPDFVIIARTDARQVEGLEAALNRGKKYYKAGADILFIEALQSEKEIEIAAAAFPDVPLLFNWAEGGKTPPIPLSRLSELGFRVVIFPISTILSATQAIRETLKSIKDTGSPAAVLPGLPSFNGFLNFIGLPEVNELEKRYRTD
jgi:2,3-dimethylmalate lyase